jgi:hypothetical protein
VREERKREARPENILQGEYVLDHCESLIHFTGSLVSLAKQNIALSLSVNLQKR